MARGGARGCLCPSETSASGATAVGLRGSAGRPGYVRCRSPKTIFLKNRLSPLYCRSSPPIMLEHLSSLPTQMVRTRVPGPCTPLWSLAASKSPLEHQLVLRGSHPQRLPSLSPPMPSSGPQKGSPYPCSVKMLKVSPENQNFASLFGPFWDTPGVECGYPVPTLFSPQELQSVGSRTN